ncbi:MAG: metal ABC transporter ATP-binding protein [[Clostridium] innocuum]|nr:ATP-binding cassette domain-containing protein [[Clostridium] innocuum]
MLLRNKEKCLISIENLTFSYEKGLTIFNNASFEIMPSEILGVYGENGSGKTTLFKILNKQLKAHWKEFYEKENLRIAILNQNDREMTIGSPLNVMELLMMYLITIHRYKRKEAIKLAKTYLTRYGLLKLSKQQLKNLSGGQIQLVMIIKTILSFADLILLDEPFAALDELTQQKILSMIQKLKQEGKTIVVIIHDPSLLNSLCDRILLCKDGKLQEVDNAKL